MKVSASKSATSPSCETLCLTLRDDTHESRETSKFTKQTEIKNLNSDNMTWTLILSILTFYGILIVVNIPAPFIGLNFDSGATPKLWYAPPGFVIPIVWFVLFTLLGIGRYNLIQAEETNNQWWLYGLAFLCATYAYYTLGFSKLTNISALWFGLIGNIAVIAFASFVIYKLFPINKAAALLTLPVIIWTAFASLIVIGEMKIEKIL